jgi:hypothetical protein
MREWLLRPKFGKRKMALHILGTAEDWENILKSENLCPPLTSVCLFYCENLLVTLKILREICQQGKT